MGANERGYTSQSHQRSPWILDPTQLVSLQGLTVSTALLLLSSQALLQPSNFPVSLQLDVKTEPD
jgi:hypothetical protein